MHSLKETIQELQAANIRVSLFVNAEAKYIEGAKNVGADRIELYTGPYAAEYKADKHKAVAAYAEAAKVANNLDLGINAGHDLNLDNLAFFKQQVPNLLEVSIGHALISEMLYQGMETTVKNYLSCLS